MTEEKNHVRLKTRVLGGASALAIAGSMLAMTAPAAHAAVTPAGSCGGQVGLAKIVPPLGDQTQPVVITTALLKDLTSKTAISGTCNNLVQAPQLNATNGAVPATLHPKAFASKLAGNSSCANGAAAMAADATAGTAYPINGKITVTMTELNALAKPWQIQEYVSLLGFNAAGPDVVDLGGIIIKGPSVGGAVSGNIWEDPVTKTGGTSGYNTGYELDLTNALGCADGTPNNASIAQTMFGGGSTSSTSLLGSTAVGTSYQFGE
jgi:hypothetical protein